MFPTCEFGRTHWNPFYGKALQMTYPDPPPTLRNWSVVMSAIPKNHLQTRADRQAPFIDARLYEVASMLAFLQTSLRIKLSQKVMGTEPFWCVQGWPGLWNVHTWMLPNLFWRRQFGRILTTSSLSFQAQMELMKSLQSAARLDMQKQKNHNGNKLTQSLPRSNSYDVITILPDETINRDPGEDCHSFSRTFYILV